LISGSNCCRPAQIHLFRRHPDGSFAERAEVRFTEPKLNLDVRGLARPYLVDWRRDGHTDLVIGYPGQPPFWTSRPFQANRWTLLVGSGQRAEKKDLKLKDFELSPALNRLELPPILGGSPVAFAFTDWDGDGRVDLLVGVEWDAVPRYNPNGSYPYRPAHFSVYWFRNTSDKGPPKFAEATHLFDVPYPWQLHALTAVSWGQNPRPSLVVSVSKRKAGELHSPLEASELWLYRSKADPRAAPDRGGK
jgi:hypothetical protein